VQKFSRHVAITALKQQRAECQPLTGRPQTGLPQQLRDADRRLSVTVISIARIGHAASDYIRLPEA
jgi:hypothetical protein